MEDNFFFAFRVVVPTSGVLLSGRNVVSPDCVYIVLLRRDKTVNGTLPYNSTEPLSLNWFFIPLFVCLFLFRLLTARILRVSNSYGPIQSLRFSNRPC